jgi:hypothetical protein
MNFSSLFTKTKKYTPRRSAEERERALWRTLLLVVFFAGVGVVGGGVWTYMFVNSDIVVSESNTTKPIQNDGEALQDAEEVCEENERVFENLLANPPSTLDGEVATTSIPSSSKKEISVFSTTEKATVVP